MALGIAELTCLAASDATDSADAYGKPPLRHRASQCFPASRPPNLVVLIERSNMSVVAIQRKSDVLGRSNLACLADIASINLTAGCARMRLLLHLGICQYTAGWLDPNLREHGDKTARRTSTKAESAAGGLFQSVERPVPARRRGARSRIRGAACALRASNSSFLL